MILSTYCCRAAHIPGTITIWKCGRESDGKGNCGANRGWDGEIEYVIPRAISSAIAIAFRV